MISCNTKFLYFMISATEVWLEVLEVHKSGKIYNDDMIEVTGIIEN